MSNILEEVKKIIRKRCYRISTTRSGRPGFLQHLFHCSKKRRRSPPNIKLETSQCIHGKISFQDGNTKINHSSPPCGGLGVHLRSARCIPTNSHVSTSQEVSEVLCTGSSLPISSHALRHHSCTKGFYQTNGRSRWASPQSTNSHFYVSGRLASQKSDSRIVTSSIKSNNTTSGRSRIDNQFRQMPFSAFTDNYLSGCSFQPEQGVSSPLREQVFGNQPSNCRYNLQPPMSSFPFFTTVGTHGFMHRYSSIWPFTYAPYPNIPSLFLAPTYRWTTFQNSSFPHTSNTLNVVATREEYFQRGTPAGISTQQSSVDRCIQVGLGCTLGHSSGGRSVDKGIDQSSYQLARDESCMECFDRVSGGDSGRESAYQMRQRHSSGIYKQARGNQINTTLSSFMGHDAVVFKTQHSHPCSSYSREKELSCRQVVPGSETCAFNRMGTQTINSSTYFSNNGNPKHRSLCHSCQLSASSVLQSLSRSPSMDMRCTVCELGGDICIFPPPILIPKVLMKVRQENCLILLVAPLAPHQSWFPQLLELIVDVPLKLPVLHDLLSQNRGLSLHPNPRSLNLAVWKISADQNLQSSFLQKLPNIWNNLSDPPHGDCIPLDGKYLVAGVLKGKSVPLQLL